MMGIDAAHLAEIVLGDFRVEFVERDELFPLYNVQARFRNGGHDGRPSATERAVAPSRVLDAIRKFKLQNNPAAMACRPMSGLNNGITDTFV